MHWLPLAEFAYNNSVHASTGVILFFAEKCYHLSIVATIQAIMTNISVPNIPDTKAPVEKLVALQAAIEQRWKEVNMTQRKYAVRRTKPSESEVGDKVWLSGRHIPTKC